MPEAFSSGTRHLQRAGTLLLLSLRVEARQPDGDEFNRGVVGALEYSDTRILYNDFIAYTPVATGSGRIRDLEPRRHL